MDSLAFFIRSAPGHDIVNNLTADFCLKITPAAHAGMIFQRSFSTKSEKYQK
jgi:hypothetical protein